MLGELLSLREITGCAVMFAAVVIAQLPANLRGKYQQFQMASGQYQLRIMITQRS
jgi:hypothetical protein